MASDFPIRTIQFTSLDFDDDTFCIRPRQAEVVPDELRNSVVRLGLLHAPVVRESSENGFQIVAGRKRLRIVRDVLGARSCNCLLLPASTPIEIIFSILLEETLICRPLTPLEKAFFFKKAAETLGLQEAAREFLPRLGMAPHPFHIKRVLALLDLEEPMLASLDAGSLDEKVALEMAKLSFRDRIVLHEIILELGLSASNQKKLVGVCWELSVRQKTSIADILAADQVRQIRTAPDANPPQKGAQLMAWLAARRSPRLYEAERQFRKFAGGLHLPAGAAITHTLSFENDNLTLSLPFKDREEFLQVWKKLKGALSAPGQTKVSTNFTQGG